MAENKIIAQNNQTYASISLPRGISIYPSSKKPPDPRITCHRLTLNGQTFLVYEKKHTDPIEFLKQQICWIIDQYFVTAGTYTNNHIPAPIMPLDTSILLLAVSGKEGIPLTYIQRDGWTDIMPISLSEESCVKHHFSKTGIILGQDQSDPDDYIYKNVIYQDDERQALSSDRVNSWYYIDFESSAFFDKKQLQVFLSNFSASLKSVLPSNLYNLLLKSVAAYVWQDTNSISSILADHLQILLQELESNQNHPYVVL